MATAQTEQDKTLPPYRVAVTAAVPRARNRLFAAVLAMVAIGAFGTVIAMAVLFHYAEAHHHALINLI